MTPEEEKAIVERMARAIKQVRPSHFHVKSDNGDACAYCGSDLRDSVHLRKGENGIERTIDRKAQAAFDIVKDELENRQWQAAQDDCKNGCKIDKALKKFTESNKDD